VAGQVAEKSKGFESEDVFCGRHVMVLYQRRSAD
jgi:hypothetical protein